MGKKKIQIKKIMDPKTQITTFSRRRNGLLKKAHELSVLCGVEVAILIFDEKNKCHVYCSNEEENAAETLMHKYINKRFRTERSKKQAELVGLECQLDGAVVGKEGYNLSDGNDNVAVVQTYQVVANNNANKDASLPFTSEDCLDKIEGLYIRSKRTYHIHTESSKKGLEAECKGSDPYYFGQFQSQLIDHHYQNGNLHSNYINHTQSTINPNNKSFQSYPYSYMMNNNYNFRRSVPDFRLLSSFENISQNTAPMVHDNLTNSICNYSDHKYSEPLLYNSLKKFNNQISLDFEISNQTESNVLSNIMQGSYTEMTANPLSPSEISADFENHLYI